MERTNINQAVMRLLTKNSSFIRFKFNCRPKEVELVIKRLRNSIKEKTKNLIAPVSPVVASLVGIFVLQPQIGLKVLSENFKYSETFFLKNFETCMNEIGLNYNDNRLINFYKNLELKSFSELIKNQFLFKYNTMTLKLKKITKIQINKKYQKNSIQVQTNNINQDNNPLNTFSRCYPSIGLKIIQKMQEKYQPSVKSH